MGEKISWKDVWEAKYRKGREESPHIRAGFDQLTSEQWTDLVKKNIIPLLNLPTNADILEVGCGAGAFLENIPQWKNIAGIDYSSAAIEQINNRFNGEFRVADAANLPFADLKFDVVISWGVFFYFKSLTYAEQVLEEMLRVLRPTGLIFVGDINDADKMDLYNQIRNSENRDEKKLFKDADMKHLFFEKRFFIEFAEKKGMAIEIFDESKLKISYYSNANYRYSVIMRH